MRSFGIHLGAASQKILRLRYSHIFQGPMKMCWGGTLGCYEFLYSGESRCSVLQCNMVLNVIFSIHNHASAITMTTEWGRWRLKSPAPPLFAQVLVQSQIIGNIIAPRQWPLWNSPVTGEFPAQCGEFTGEFPAQWASNAENVSIWWRHHREHEQIENNACTRVTNCLCAHEMVILVFISRVACNEGNKHQNNTRVIA